MWEMWKMGSSPEGSVGSFTRTSFRKIGWKAIHQALYNQTGTLFQWTMSACELTCTRSSKLNRVACACTRVRVFQSTLLEWFCININLMYYKPYVGIFASSILQGVFFRSFRRRLDRSVLALANSNQQTVSLTSPPANSLQRFSYKVASEDPHRYVVLFPTIRLTAASEKILL